MLSGELAVVIPPTQARRVVDLVTRNWKRSLLQMAACVLTFSPVKRKPGRCWSHFSQKAAEQCNLQAGTPVIAAGGGDVQLAARWRRTAQTAVLGGTFPGNRSSIFPAPVTDPNMNVRTVRSPVWYKTELRLSFSTGLTMRWFRDAFAPRKN